MLPRYKIEYAVTVHGHEQPGQYCTDDPVTCEEFLSELLELGFPIRNMLHEGAPLPQVESDRMIRTAAGMLATRALCRSLRIDHAEAHHRFGTPA